MLLHVLPLFLALAASQGPGIPAQQVDGLLGVAIDIQAVEAQVVFDVERRTAQVSATMEFAMLEEGMPLFDLRQTINRAQLDGEDIPVDALAAHDFGRSSGTMRLLQRKLAKGSRHTLHFQYQLGKPQSPRCQAIGWGDGTLDWDFFFSDLNPGRYLEMWFPANLLYDHFPFTLDLAIEGTQIAHELVTNAEVEAKGDLHWLLKFPPHFTSFSQMLVVVPSADVERKQDEIRLPNGEVVVIDVCRRHEAASSMRTTIKKIREHIQEFSENVGIWPHGNRVTVFVWTGSRSMEYDGATTTSMGALRHELFHSWFGRGAKPRSQNDGWLDEAWDVYFADHGRAPKSELKKEGSPVQLCSNNPMNRTTPGLSYSAGAMFFGRVALLVGEKELEKQMAAFFQKYQLKTFSTQDLEQHLVEATGEEKIHALFARYVYGQKD